MIGAAGRAFNVVLYNYAYRVSPPVYVYAPDKNPAVPDYLIGDIQNIAGLNNIPRNHYAHIQHTASGTQHPRQRYADANTKFATKPLLGPGGGFTPTELRGAYNVNPLISAGNDGTGQTIGVFELDGYSASDVDYYRSNYGLGTGKYTNVLVDGATTNPGSGAIEVELDMEVVSAIAPGAAQRVYIGPNSTTGLNDTYNRIVMDNLVKVTTTSWGLCESSSGNSELAALDTIFTQGAAQGQAFFAASGDSGAYDCNGGGVSSYFTRPSYQTGTNLTQTNRMVPDVSADADPQSGYSVYCTSSGSYCSGWLSIGGTSAAAPLWASIAIDLNQYLASQGKPTLGNAHQPFYNIYNGSQPYTSFHDVTTGNNLYYQAGPNYDMATGIGTPNAGQLASALAGGTTPTPPPGGTKQLITNGGFENGRNPWIEHSSSGYEMITSIAAHSGKYSAFFCAYNNSNDVLYQAVTIPSNSNKIVLSYWLYSATLERNLSQCSDKFTASLLAANGKLIGVVSTRCNANSHGWVQYTFDLTSALSSYKGQQVILYFTGTTNRTNPSVFLLDDVSMLDYLNA